MGEYVRRHDYQCLAKVTEYSFSTVVSMPGMWRYEDAQIQFVDTPPVTAEHADVGLWGTIHSADVVDILADSADESLEQTETTLHMLGG